MPSPDTLLLVGTQEGHLLVYDVCNTETNSSVIYFLVTVA
jgi:hypothetical protein